MAATFFPLNSTTTAVLYFPSYLTLILFLSKVVICPTVLLFGCRGILVIIAVNHLIMMHLVNKMRLWRSLKKTGLEVDLLENTRQVLKVGD